ncbi:MAG: NAD(P)-dependent alcohol dehydrogenase [Actinobacteria bacterium]|nr:NAD(P)-dependent alcohol dehydrogenase [Actinomycetota bacterium]
MKAVVRYTYGDESVLEYTDLPDPVPGPGEVLVRVRAAGVDRGAWHIMTGLPHLARLAFGLRRPRDPRLGMDAAGVVEAVGPDVTAFRVGDEVLGVVRGSFAELAIAAERHLVAKPATVSWEQAAAAPTSTITAFDALRTRVTSGTRVLVLGAGGGVGHLAVQVARVLGGEVTAATSDPAFAASVGVSAVIDYRTEALTGTYDVILDNGGRRPVRELRALLSPAGSLVFVGGEGGGALAGGMQRQFVVAPFSRQKFVTFVARTTPAALREVAEHLADGTVVPVVDRTYPLAEAADALRQLSGGRVRGKLVLLPGAAG